MGLTRDQIANLSPSARKQIQDAIGNEPKVEKKSKMNNKRVVCDGIIFMSIREKDRYIMLKFMEKQKIISNLRLQVPYELQVDGHRVEKYIADFVYIDTETKTEIIEDCKGMRTPTYRRKKKWMKNIYGIVIKET